MDGSYFGVKHLKYFRGGDFKELCSVSSCIPARALRREVGLKAGKLSCRDTCSSGRNQGRAIPARGLVTALITRLLQVIRVLLRLL